MRDLEFAATQEHTELRCNMESVASSIMDKPGFLFSIST